MKTINRDLWRMMKTAKEQFGTEAAEFVFRAYTAGLRDAATDLIKTTDDLSRQFEAMNLEAL